MDGAAAARSSQKRRRGKPQARRGGEGAGLDRISELPDEILGVILSRFSSTKAAARTAVLSSRWRYIWRSTTLDLTVDADIAGQERNRITAVSQILAAHHARLHRLSLKTIRLGRDRGAKFDGWFRSPALDVLEELQFYGAGTPPRYRPLSPMPLPPSALRFAPTLRAASIGGCDFPDINAGFHFPLLKRLKIYDACISEAALRRLLAGCILLEGLELLRIHGLSSVQIVSPNLQTICVSLSIPFYQYCLETQPELNELVIEDAPCLERLMQVGPLGPREIKIIAAPKLTVLGYLFGDMNKSLMSSIFVKGMIPIPFTGSMHAVKILALESFGPNLNLVLQFLRCFPALEKLYIESCNINVRQKDISPVRIECLDQHLKEIVLNGYEGKRREVKFAKFFVLNASVLKVMKFGASGNCDEKWVANQREQLDLDNSASIDAEFFFKRDGVASSFHHYKHIHDMWMPDPFDSSFCKCC